MMLKKINLLWLLLTTLPCAFAQIGIGTSTPHSSSVLEIAGTTGKGVLFPQVQLATLNSTTTPIVAPVDGMIVYNKGGQNLPGYYLWRNNLWNLLADQSTLTSNMVLQSTANYPVLGGLANGTFKNFTDGNYTVFYNNSDATYSSGRINLTTGIYNISVQLIVTTPQESPTLGVANNILHIHRYLGRISDGTTTYGDIQSASVQSNGGGNKKHLARFNFVVKIATPTSVFFSLAHTTGGTYQNGLGGIAPNNGEVVVSKSIISVQKSIVQQ